VRTVTTQGQGAPVPLRGAADLEVIVDARAEQGDEWFQQDRDMVDTLDRPGPGSRLVVDVAHRW
jgi:hypothetical protein